MLSIWVAQVKTGFHLLEFFYFWTQKALDTFKIIFQFMAIVKTWHGIYRDEQRIIGRKKGKEVIQVFLGDKRSLVRILWLKKNCCLGIRTRIMGYPYRNVLV